MATPQSFFLPFLRQEQVAKDTYSFYFDRHAYSFDFKPGEYIRMILPHENQDERGNTRNFSIASSPLEKDFLMVTTKVVQSSFKKKLASLQPGEKVEFWGPVGRFIFDEQEVIPHVLLAGGIGVTPYHSMITYAASKNLTVPITLLASFSTGEEFVYYDEFTQIAQKHPNIQIVYTMTHPEESTAQWQGETGRISEEMIRKYVRDLQQAKYYIVGPPKMVQAVEEIVKDMGISQEHIKKENFVGY